MVLCVALARLYHHNSFACPLYWRAINQAAGPFPLAGPSIAGGQERDIKLTLANIKLL